MNFDETNLFKSLKSKNTIESDELSKILEGEKVLPKIQTILKSANNSPKDFTLHDNEHSYRVAQKMTEIIGESTLNLLSEYEIFLLLLSAYLHDIGMTPEQNKVDELKKLILDGNSDKLSEIEIDDFQLWLDSNGHSVEIRKRNTIDSYETEVKFNFILTHYCRYKHNDWSEDWIINNLKFEVKNYPNWQLDLINICKSHHWGIDELKKDIFDPKPVKDKIVHLRFLAMCLRVSDVMENDPERTPNVIFQHRNIIKDSEIYWYKDHEMNTNILSDGRISFFARPKRAFMEKAVKQTLEDIKNEIELCEKLIVEKPLDYIKSKPSERLPHQWVLKSNIVEDIKPSPDTYEYIDGTFRPDTEKILELLGGTQLYENRFNAVRELLQNSFDAIKLQIAHKIVNENIPKEQWTDDLRNQYLVELSLKKIDNDYWLVCSDSGIGMTKEIIRNNFLVSGKSKDKSLIELERKCKSIGYDIERTGQFGIGVLSYFMIADKIIIKTKRTQDTGYDTDLNGWEFEIDSIRDFGELKKVKKPSKGTEVHLKLKKEFVENDDISKWEQKLIAFLNDTLKKVNCKFRYKGNGLDSDINFETGWCFDNHSQNKILLKNVENTFQNKSEMYNLDFFDEVKQSKIKRGIALLPEFKKDMEQVQNFIIEDGIIPNRNVYYKIIVPYYALESGASFVYFYEKNNVIYPCYNKLCVVPIPSLNYSWKGMKTTASTQTSYSLMYGGGRNPIQKIQVHFDLCEEIDNKNISVSRNHCQLSPSFENELFKFIDDKFDEILKREVIFRESKYAFINMLVSNSPIIIPEKYYWFFQKDAFSFELNQITRFYPTDFEIHFTETNHKTIAISQNLEIPLISKFPGELFQSGYFNFLSKFHTVTNMKKLVSYCEDVTQIPELIQNRREYILLNQHEPPLISSFPKGYENITLVLQNGNGQVIYFNESNEFLRGIDLKKYYFVTQIINQNGLNSSVKEQILISKDLQVCFLLYILTNNRYINLFKNDSSFLKQVFDGIIQKNVNSMLIFNPNSITQINIPKNETQNLSYSNEFDNSYPNLFDSKETLNISHVQLPV